jgi:hypothetical protein
MKRVKIPMPTPRLTKNTDPTLRGKLGDAWLLDVDTITRRRGMVDDPRRFVSLPSWICSASYAHPAWSHYWITGLALRDHPGVTPAKINLEGATHEVMVYALSPDHPYTVDDFPRFLTPANFHGQFIEPSDDAAAARVQQAVQDVIDGVLSPDTDFRRYWVQRFSATRRSTIICRCCRTAQWWLSALARQ